MAELRAWLTEFLRRTARWGRSPDRESLLEAHSTGPCPQCGEERIRARDVRVDDLGYSVRVRERWSCGCHDGPEERVPGPGPAGVR